MLKTQRPYLAGSTLRPLHSPKGRRYIVLESSLQISIQYMQYRCVALHCRARCKLHAELAGHGCMDCPACTHTYTHCIRLLQLCSNQIHWSHGLKRPPMHRCPCAKGTGAHHGALLAAPLDMMSWVLQCNVHSKCSLANQTYPACVHQHVNATKRPCHR